MTLLLTSELLLASIFADFTACYLSRVPSFWNIRECQGVVFWLELSGNFAVWRRIFCSPMPFAFVTDSKCNDWIKTCQIQVMNVCKRTDTCIERCWQGVGLGEVELTTKVINATSTVWNFTQTPAWNVREFYFWRLDSNSAIIGDTSSSWRCTVSTHVVFGRSLYSVRDCGTLCLDCCVTLATALLALDVVWRHFFSQSELSQSVKKVRWPK